LEPRLERRLGDDGHGRLGYHWWSDADRGRRCNGARCRRGARSLSPSRRRRALHEWNPDREEDAETRGDNRNGAHPSRVRTLGRLPVPARDAEVQLRLPAWTLETDRDATRPRPRV